MGDGHRSLFRKVKKKKKGGRAEGETERDQEKRRKHGTRLVGIGIASFTRGAQKWGPRQGPSFPMGYFLPLFPLLLHRALNGFKRSPRRRQWRQHATELGQCAPAGQKFWFIIAVILARDTREQEPLLKNPKYTPCAPVENALVIDPSCFVNPPLWRSVTMSSQTATVRT